MIEVEMKLPVHNRHMLEEKLISLGFRMGNLVKESDVYFNGEVQDLRKADKALRVRTCENMITGEKKSFLTYKGPKLDTISMTRKELEASIQEPEIMKEIFTSIGFIALCPVIKLRQYYHLGKMTACMDQVEGLGDFLELEVLAENESDRENALDEIKAILKKLGCEVSDTSRRSYLSMLLNK